MEPDEATLQLPTAIVGLIDVGRLIRELDKVEANLQQQSIRTEADADVKLPKFSLLLDQLVDKNQLDLLKEEDRRKTHDFLKQLRQHAPKVHMSFSANPSPRFIQTLTAWLRQNIHPQLLVAIGLQPGIGAGCVLRTTNKYFDLSLAKSFAESRDVLMKYLRGPEGGAGQTMGSSDVLPPTSPVEPPAQGAAA